MNDYKDYELNSIFRQDFQKDDYSYANSTISLERVNQLFKDGSITSTEHSELIKKLYPFEKKISAFAVLSLILSSINWILILKFSYGDDVYQLLTGENRYYVSLFMAPISLIFFFLAYSQIKKDDQTKGFSIAIAGATLAVAILSVTIPVFFMRNLG